MATSLLIICFVAVGCAAYPLGKIGENEPFSVESLPTDFGSYDTNANGYIDLEELAKTAGITVDDTRKPFMDADIDDDNQVSPEEFEKAPWSFKFADELFLREEEEDDDNTKGLETELTTLYDSSEDMSIDLGEKTLGSDEENGPVTFETIEETPTPELIDDISDMPREEKFDEDSEYEVEEEPVEEKDGGESQDFDKEEDESDDEDEDDDVIDPLYNEDDHQLRKQDNLVSEEEFVENAIY